MHRPLTKMCFLQLLQMFTVQYFSSAKLLPTHISSNLDVNLLYYLIFCLSTNKGRVTGWPWGHRQISEMRQASLKFITAKPLIEAKVLIELGSSTVGRLLVGKYARQGAAWQAGVLHGCQQKPPQIVWEISLSLYYIYLSVFCSSAKKKSAGALPSTSRLFFWTSSLPTLQQSQPPSVQIIHADLLCTAQHSLPICSTRFPPRYSKKISSQRSHAGVTRWAYQNGTLVQSWK